MCGESGVSKRSERLAGSVASGCVRLRAGGDDEPSSDGLEMSGGVLTCGCSIRNSVRCVNWDGGVVDVGVWGVKSEVWVS